MIQDVQGILVENECRTCGCRFGNHSGEKYWARLCGLCLQLFCASCVTAHVNHHNRNRNFELTGNDGVVVWDWRREL